MFFFPLPELFVWLLFACLESILNFSCICGYELFSAVSCQVEKLFPIFCRIPLSALKSPVRRYALCRSQSPYHPGRTRRQGERADCVGQVSCVGVRLVGTIFTAYLSGKQICRAGGFFENRVPAQPCVDVWFRDLWTSRCDRRQHCLHINLGWWPSRLRPCAIYTWRANVSTLNHHLCPSSVVRTTPYKIDRVVPFR